MAQEIPGSHLIGDFGQKALITKGDAVLMCRAIGDKGWDFPGGRLHTGEDLAEGLKRELKEELGVEATIGEPFFTAVWYGSSTGLPRILVLYKVEMQNTADSFDLPPDEIEEVRWVHEADIADLATDPIWKAALTKHFAVR